MTQQLSVLYAEDHRETARRFAQEMEAYGFEVHAVHDGLAALQAFRDLKPDIVVLDYRMPGANGLEAAAVIRKEDSKVPILILSSYSEYAVTTLKKGYADFIRKDATTEEICLRIEKAWRASQHLLPADKVTGASDEVYYLSEDSLYNASTLTLSIDEKRIPLGSKLGKLFARLCREQNHFVPVEALCEELWGIYSKNKKKQLQDYVSQLRKILEDIPEVAVRYIDSKGFLLHTIDY